jgi:oxygen-independent coproporphyrinogen III oxidase
MTTSAAARIARARELAARAYIEAHRDRRHSNRVLHGHPSPVLWRHTDISVPTVMRARESDLNIAPKRLNLYVATPYCLPTKPDRCGFCLFPSEIYEGRPQLDRYLWYLEREGELYRPFLEGSPLTSVYFGGGTSNLYRADQYARLLHAVRNLFSVQSDDTEVTLEGIPQLFTLEKLHAMRTAGCTRISIGVQQLDDDMIAMSGRRQKAAQVFDAIAWCHRLGLAVSVDLIFGWPRQTTTRMLRDLKAIVDAGVDHLTHYELNVGGPTDFAVNRRHELPSVAETLEMYRAGRDFLCENGYRQVTTYDWERVDSPRPRLVYEDEWRHRLGAATDAPATGSQTWGWGFAGISHFFSGHADRGWTYINHSRVADYFDALDAGRFPIERGFHYVDEADFRLTVLFQMLISLRVDRGLYAAIADVDVVHEFADIWDALIDLGWARVTPAHLELIGDGVFYTPLIQSLLAQDRVVELRRSMVAGAVAYDTTDRQEAI